MRVGLQITVFADVEARSAKLDATPGIGWLDWPTVDADSHARMSVLVDVCLVAVMAVLAQRLQLTRQERVPVTPMRNDVVAHSRGNGETARLAHPTQRLDLKLVSPNAPPALELIPRAGVVLPRC